MILAGLMLKLCFFLLNDVIINSADFEGHMQALQKVLSAVVKSGLKFKLIKFLLCQTSVAFLGHTMCKQGVAPDPANEALVENYPWPSNVTEVESFLGLAVQKDFAQIC